MPYVTCPNCKKIWFMTPGQLMRRLDEIYHRAGAHPDYGMQLPRITMNAIELAHKQKRLQRRRCTKCHELFLKKIAKSKKDITCHM